MNDHYGVTIAAAPKSTSFSRDLVFAVPLIAAGIACLVLLALSDARGSVSFPPDDSLYSVQNWLQAAAVVVGGLVIAVPSAPKNAKAAASAVALISSGMLLGSALVALKHWRPVGGMDAIPVKRTESMEQLSVMIAVAAVMAALVALCWLMGTRTLPVQTTSTLRTLAVITGVVTIGAVPVIVGIGSAETMDTTSLGAFALIYSLPWGIAFLLSGYLAAPAAGGALATVAASAGLTVLTPPMRELVFGTAVPAGLVVLLASAWLMVLQRRAVKDAQFAT